MIFWIKDIAYHKERYSRQTEVNVRVSRRKARKTDAREKSGIRGETTVDDGVFVATQIHNFVA